MMEFVVPDLGGRPTGGTRYNARLIEELGGLGVEHCGCSPEAIRDAALICVDSLYLERVAQIRGAHSGARIALILHYLPSLVRHGVEALELSAIERAALAAADLLLVPNRFMARVA